MGLGGEPKMAGPIKTLDDSKGVDAPPGTTQEYPRKGSEGRKNVDQRRDPEQEGQLEKLGQRLDNLGKEIDGIVSKLKALAQDAEFQRDIVNGMEVLKREDPVEYERILKILKRGLG
ncbi:MAG: hypothetical protein Q8Q13_03400 [bacterium]|nr:hypothetical protein [bacterium]